MEIRIAEVNEIEKWWDKKIKACPNDLAYKKWKENFVSGNINGERKTFLLLMRENMLDKAHFF